MKIIKPSNGKVDESITGLFSTGSNRKLGPNTGNLNRRRMKTCPGSSEWCEENCYANKALLKYWQNSYETELKNIPNTLPKLVRLHSSGDFDTVPYIKWVEQLVEDNPKTRFWAYTRSWRLPSLRRELIKLKKMDNIEIFASTDPSIREPTPKGWRVAWVETDNRAEGVYCPHDKGNVENCEECGICYEDSNKNVIFKKK